MLFIAVIGPSGVGKSACCARAAETQRWKHIDLDQELRFEGKTNSLQAYRSAISPEDFFASALKICTRKRAESAHIDTLVDIGAGIQDFDQTQVIRWLRSDFDHVISIMDNKENCHHRRHLQRTLEQYCAQEFSENREKIYKSAHLTYHINGRSRDDSCNGFIDELKRVFTTIAS